MQKRLLLAFLITLLATFAFADYVEIGTGTSYQAEIPVNGLYDYNWSGAIYTAAEIGQPIEISSISYNVYNTPSNYTMPNQTIYMTHWTEDTFSNADYPDPANNGYTLVYSGAITYNGSGWHEIQLDNVFSYNGEDNLAIFVENNDGDWGSGYPSFYYTNITDAAKYKHLDNSFPAVAGALSIYRADVRLHWLLAGAPGLPAMPSPVHEATGVTVGDTDLMWTWGVDTATYDLYFDTVDPPVTLVVTDGEVTGAVESYNPGTLSSNTTYYWQVVAKNAAERLTTPGPVWSFTTEILPVTSYPYFVDFEDGVLPVGWVQDTGDQREWALDQNGTPSGSTGPNVDHTTGTATGWYCYYETSNYYTGDIANLETIEFDITSLPSPKLNFWYHMYGSSMGTLNVDVWDGEVWNNVWTMSGNQNNTWLEAYVDLSPFNDVRSTIKIRFQGVRGDNYYSDMAIDDIMVANIVGGPPGAPNTPYPADGQANIGNDPLVLTWNFGEYTDLFDLYIDTVNPPVTAVLTDEPAVSGMYNMGTLPSETTYYWRVVAKNGSRLVTSSPVWSFTTALPGGIIQIGGGNVTSMSLPAEPYYSYSLSQTIYMQSDINVAGKQLEKIWYHYNGHTARTEESVQIWMKHTTQNTLTDYLPMSGFRLVYDGPVTVLDADAWVEIDLMNPFYYNNTDNLVIMTRYNTYGWGTDSDEFFCTAGGNVSIEDHNDTDPYDPAAPPTGTIRAAYPNIRMDFGNVPVATAGEVYISEVSDNLVGMPDDTGYIEFYNMALYPVDLSGCMVGVGVDDGGTFVPAPVQPYVFPAGTLMMPQTYLTLTNGASAAAFEAAWGLDPGMNIVACDVDLQIVNGEFAYMLDGVGVRLEVDHTPNITANGAIVQQEIGVWVPSTPTESTPGDYSPGQTLPVELSSFAAVLTVSNTVMIEWATQSETDALGYHVLRGESSDLSLAAYITDSMINATNSSQEVTYSVEDIDVDVSHSYYYWLETIDTDGTSDRFGPVMCAVTESGGEEPPASYEVTMIGQNYPNPFNPTTMISYSIKGTVGMAVPAELAIYNVRGQRVRTLFSGPQDPCENQTIEWNGDDDAGQPVGSGVYFYKLTTPGFSEIHKMMLLK